MDKTEFSKRVMDAEQSLYLVSKVLLFRNADCEDVVQDAILKAYLKRDSLREVKYFKTWLTRIVINECYQFLRRKKQEVSYEGYMALEPAEDERYTELYDAIQRLDVKHKLPIVLYYIEGYSVAEISLTLKVPSGTVKSRLSRGRQMLKDLLESEEIL